MNTVNHENLNNIKMKESNTRLLLRNIRSFGPISRKDLVSITGLTPASVTNIAKALLDDGYILEVGDGLPSGGRKPTLIEINPHRGYVMGIELTSTMIALVLVDFSSRILDRFLLEFDINLELKEETIDRIVMLAQQLLDHNAVERKDLLGIGFISCGPFDFEKNIMLKPLNFLGWENVPIVDILQERLGVTVRFERESVATGMSEYWLCKSDVPQYMLCINILDVGIGGGLIVNGQVYRGFLDAALSIGHVKVDDGAMVCNCGNTGCLEVMADGQALRRYYYAQCSDDTKGEQTQTLSLDEILEKADECDPAALYAVDRCAYYIGTAMSNLMNILGPDVIVINGPIIHASDLLFQKIVQYGRSRTYPKTKAKIRIARSSFGIYSNAMGGVALIFRDMLSP